jgi:hypothetical protein
VRKVGAALSKGAPRQPVSGVSLSSSGSLCAGHAPPTSDSAGGRLLLLLLLLLLPLAAPALQLRRRRPAPCPLLPL